MKKFSLWLLLFIILLAGIPLLLHFGNYDIARFFGILTVISIIIALWIWRIQTKLKSPKNERIKLNTNDLYWLNKHIPFFSKLTKGDKKIFQDRIGLFIANITITEINNEYPEKETCLYVASSAVIAYWGLPYWNYGDLSEVLVYPTNFNIDNSLNQLGMVQGKVYHGGLMNNTMIISLPALINGFQIDNDKKNVGVHEFTHLLDKSDGEIDGIPPMLGEEDRKIWVKIIEKEIEKIKKGKSTIPKYASSNHSEFFAVVIEYYKECPKLLKIKHPELFNAIDSMYSN